MGMAESTKVRLVRCPKCDNLLPELADYSVYQCGGCGAVLRAREKNPEGDTLSDNPEVDTVSDKSDDGVVNGIEAQVNKDSQDQGMVDFSDVSDVDVKSGAESFRSEEKKPDKDDSAGGGGAMDQSKAISGKLVVENVVGAGADRDGVAGKEQLVSVSQNENLSDSWRSGRISSLQRRGMDEAEGLRRGTRNEVGAFRYSTSNYQDEGPSNYNLNSSYGYGDEFRNQGDHGGDSRVQYLENDRADLLRKLEELKQQLSRSAVLTDIPTEAPPINGRMAPPNPHQNFAPWVSGGSSAPNGAPAVQFYGPGSHTSVPPYFNHHPDTFPYSNSHQETLQGFLHPSMHKSSQIPRYGDPFFGHQLPRRDPHPVPGQYQQPVHGNFSGRRFDDGPGPFDPHPSSGAHPPACSCYHCYNRHPGCPPPIPLNSFSNSRFPDTSSSPVLYHQDVPLAFGSSAHTSRNAAPPPMNDHALQPHMRWPSNANSEMGGFVRFHPRKVVLASSSKHYNPIGGGAPFLTCYNCFEVIRIPKVLLSVKKQQKVQCGSCSTIIKFSVLNKKLIISRNTEAGQASAVADDGSRMVMIDESSYSYGTNRRTNANATFSSEDYDNSGYDFQAIDPDSMESSMAEVLNSAKPHEVQRFSSSSPNLSEDDNSLDALAAPREGMDSVEQPVKAILSSPQPGSPLQHYFDYSNYNRGVNRSGKGSRSSRSDQEKAITNKASARQNSMKEASVATEMDVSFQEYPSTGVSQEAVSGKEDNPSNSRKGVESFFANFIKKSLKDISKGNQTDGRGRSTVSVNGHVIPDKLVKRAEKLAGPVNPGEYWYDPKAGFWGVLGGPCLGMIPPSIEEFNYPMPEDCSGGDTGVFVNGRELRQKDLDLLASRGLPTETDRSYVVSSSGRVVDEDTGEELETLGKLAPTVERAKRGFGMKVPKVAAS